MAVSTSNNSQEHETDSKLISLEHHNNHECSDYEHLRPSSCNRVFLSLLDLGMALILTTQGIIVFDWVHFPAKQSCSYSQRGKIFANYPSPVWTWDELVSPNI